MPDENDHPPEPDNASEDADELLDRLERRADSRSRPRPRISGMIVTGLLFLMLAMWQFVHLANGGADIFKPSSQTDLPPTVTRSERLMRLRAERKSGDLIAAYIARSKRGMTDNEIRWVIEDFQALGLDQQEHGLNGIRRTKEQQWYLQAMSKALQLSEQQRAQAKARMDALLEEDVKTFEKGIAGVGGNPNGVRISDETPIMPAAGATVWLFKDAYAPWNLCDLTPEQDRLTMHRWRDAESKTSTETPESADSEMRAWTRIPTARLDPSSGKLIETDENDPYGLGSYKFYRIVPTWMSMLDAFPFIPEQKPHGQGLTGLDQARGLQAPQFRLALLMNPSASTSLLMQLAQPVTQDSPAQRSEKTNPSIDPPPP